MVIFQARLGRDVYKREAGVHKAAHSNDQKAFETHY